MKEVYEAQIQEQLANDCKASKRIESSSEGVTSHVGGKYVLFPLHIGRNQGMGARLENELLPTAGNQSYTQAKLNLSYQYAAIRLTGQTFELADSDFQSFASALDQEVSGIKRDVAKDYNRQIFGTSVGALGTATGAYAAVTIPMTNTQYMAVGQIVDIYASDTTTLRAAGRNVVTVNKNVSIVVDGANIAAGAIGDIVARLGSITREIIGFQQIVNDTGILHQVNPATVPLWKSVMNGNAGVNRPLSESDMIRMSDDIVTNGGKSTVIWSNLGVRRSYYNLLVQARRYHDTKDYGGGFSGLSFTTDNGDIPMMTDIDCQPNRMYFLNEKEIKQYREKDWSWMDRNGNKWQWVQQYDAYEARLYKYFNFGTHRRNTHGLLSDITES
jgi:hypothetical protein